MYRLAWIAVPLFLLADADVPQIMRLRQQTATQANIPSTESLPVLPDFSQSPEQAKQPAKKAARLQPQSRLALVRYVHSEFARAVRPLPAGRHGFRMAAGKPLDDKTLQQMITVDGIAVNPGDTVQITKMEFKDTQIVFDLNGGGRGRTRWRDRIQVQMSGAPIPQVSTTRSDPNPPPNAPTGRGRGCTLILDFGRPLPDMTPDELKQQLSAVLDFSKQRSASVLWTQSLPPEMQKAIEQKRAVVGMDRDMVLAAMGKPERKVRERDANGMDTEEWIYGQPPGKTVFVRFAGDRVTRVEQFPQ